jgi:CRISPR-associated endonuclease/helicase Cas3
MTASDFPLLFEKLTGNAPFPWQQELFTRLYTGVPIPLCDVPTGLGKTSAMAIWLVALGVSLSENGSSARVPRRLVYIVDRRVVVDQATSEVESLREKLSPFDGSRPAQELRPLLLALQNASVVPDEAGFSISTLRGQFADNHQWHFDVTRPAIVVGTVDMTGSRLLFSGYGGLGPYSRSLHAALLGQDSWIVLDEAHLSPSFNSLLTGFEQFAGRGSPVSLSRVTRMSATLPVGNKIIKAGTPIFTGRDMADSRVQKRVNASKILRFIFDEPSSRAVKPAERAKALGDRMAAEALKLGTDGAAVVVFADTVNLVNIISGVLKAGLKPDHRDRVLSLTGEMRGFERDRITAHPVIMAFDPKRDRTTAPQPAFIVATACVEVGMDFDADHAVCDLVALERMIQRLGRVNRRGEGSAQIHLVTTVGETSQPIPNSTGSSQDASVQNSEEATLRVLGQLPGAEAGYNASPSAMRGLDLTTPLAIAAHTQPPITPPLDAARLDDWSFTGLSAKEYARPKVSYWLRGVIDDETATTSFLWRADLSELNDSDENSANIAVAMTEAIPPALHELAQVATYRAAEILAALADKSPQSLAVLISSSGVAEAVTLESFADSKKQFARIAFGTIVLPTNIGGLLEEGLPSSSKEALNRPAVDVIDPENWIRVMFRRKYGEVTAHALPDGVMESCSGADFTEAYVSFLEALQAKHPTRIIRCQARVGVLATEDEPGGDDQAREGSFLVAYFEMSEGKSVNAEGDAAAFAGQSVTIDAHHATIERVAHAITQRLNLSGTLAEAVVLAARLHDTGKARPQWQRAIGNLSGTPLAKSDGSYFDLSQTNGYRHEFGSLIDASSPDQPALKDHPQRDLILHLIAAHHGHARPIFSEKQFDHTSTPTAVCRAIAAEVPLRFERLQREYGWWTLAYLEALVKSADAIASTHPNWSDT